ncbi:hypothetical protein SAMN05192529_107119 [Arachidicoccus rhizosphaerae]|uniref:Uncharacterized protein n=1 Tax=Arachidicoccus rhizosphaerae TaxID=551991 RepID=A0A1H3Y5U1_9BACT|nr:hypothetical protein [Arachidicoccus rhizosphaerae]SEA06920.1 hypothetical protein SAMN05192529_107119 [Arachidicoccus rhizosphaerae]
MNNGQQSMVKYSLKKIYTGLVLLAVLLLAGSTQLMAQCALCTKTAQQLGDGPAAGLNKGILYLMVIPISILSIIGFKWYKKEKITRALEDSESQVQ